MNEQELFEIASQAIRNYAENNDLTIDETYSGKEMFGQICIGLVTDAQFLETLGGVLQEALVLAEDQNGDMDDRNALIDLLISKCRWDDMGIGSVVLYWPSM